MAPLRILPWSLALLAAASAAPAAEPAAGQPSRAVTPTGDEAGRADVGRRLKAQQPERPRAAVALEDGPAPEKFWVFVGTYTGGRSAGKGVYRLEFDTATGQLSHLAVA